MRKEWRQSKIAEKIHNEWCKENGYPVRAASINPIELRKQQASRITIVQIIKLQAASIIANNARFKQQAASSKLLDSFSLIKFWDLETGIEN